MHKRLLLGCLVLIGCQQADVRAFLTYDLITMSDSRADTHYEHFAVIDGFAVSLGCFVVERRQTDCLDSIGERPNLLSTVVECKRNPECPVGSKAECNPCTCARIANPCEDSAKDFPMVTDGEIRGIVNGQQGVLSVGGAEFATPVDLVDATRIFISEESHQDTSQSPSPQRVMHGDLTLDGAVLRGILVKDSRVPARGNVTIVPISDGVNL
jgi:hypothetical protein